MREDGEEKRSCKSIDEFLREYLPKFFEEMTEGAQSDAEIIGSEMASASLEATKKRLSDG
ncbi:MAG: hypothetical protein KAU99_01185 [Thermoplasmata archaeon]|nr:hypothetical protein [Thermoplasmata archaeon]